MTKQYGVHGLSIEPTKWLNYYVPKYRKKCEEQELEWEANHSEVMNNWGDWRD